jgi:hypothetical protein
MGFRWRTLVPGNCAPGVEFQPSRETQESENYGVELSEVAVLELVIVPDAEERHVHP